MEDMIYIEKDKVKNIKIKLYKRPKNKKVINKLKWIVSTLTPEWFSEEVVENFCIDLNYQDVFVLYDKNIIRSFIMFTCLDTFMHITLFATNYEDLNKGYGTNLYKYFENYCVKNNFKKFSVMTISEEKNTNYHNTIEFYKKHGFKMTKLLNELNENGTILFEKIL